MNKRFVRLVQDMVLASVLSVLIALIWLNTGELPHHAAWSVLPLIWLGLRHGGPTAILSGVIVGLITGAIAGHFGDLVSTALVDVLPYTAAGLAGFFAKYTQKTLNNRRYSSTYLNMGTASLLVVAGYLGLKIGMMWLLQQVIPYTVTDFLIAVLQSGGVALVILIVFARTNVNVIIPKRSRYLTRKEVSRLLND